MQYNLTIHNDTSLDDCTFAVSGYPNYVRLQAGETKTILAKSEGSNTVSTTIGGSKLLVNYDQEVNSVWYSGAPAGTYQLMAIYGKDATGAYNTDTTVTLSPMATLYNDLHNVAVFFTVDGVLQPQPLSVSQVRATRAPEKTVTATFTPPSPANLINGIKTGQGGPPAPAEPDVVLTVLAYKDKSETATGGGARLVSAKDPITGAISYRVQINDPSSALAVFSRPRPPPSPTPKFVPHRYLNPISVTAIIFAAVFYILFMVFLALYLYDRR